MKICDPKNCTKRASMRGGIMLSLFHCQQTYLSALAPITCLLLATSVSAEPKPPSFATLEEMIREFFVQPGDRQKPQLITQSQVHDLLEQLRGMHIQIPGRHQIVRSFPHDKEFFSRFVLSELAHEPSDRFPADPTFLFQRIDAMCTTHNSLRHFLRIAGEGRAFEVEWIPQDPLFPPLESLATKDVLRKHQIESADEVGPRRRNYTVEHLLEALRASYDPNRESASHPVLLNTLGR